jgi:hypothetical protein
VQRELKGHEVRNGPFIYVVQEGTGEYVQSVRLHHVQRPIGERARTAVQSRVADQIARLK